MSAPLVALGGQPTDVMGQFSQGQRQALGMQQAKREEFEKFFQIVGSASMYALGGNPNGQADPAKYSEVMDGLTKMGMKIPDNIRTNPGFANIAANASLTALQQIQLAKSDAEAAAVGAKFERDMMESDRTYNLARDKFEYLKGKGADGGGAQSPLGKLKADLDSGLIDQATYDAAIKKATAENGGITVSPDGTVTIGGQLGKLTEGQSKDVNYYIRGKAALETLDQFESALTSIKDSAADSLPGGNYLTSKEYQQGNQAGREFLASILRKDTGAAITKQEFEIYGPMFLPQPGDGVDVLAQKKVARTRAIEAIKTGLGAKGDALPADIEKTTGGKPDSADVTSQEQYDALPSGAEFMSGGKRYRKP